MDGSFGPLKSFSIKALNQFVDDDVALKIKKKFQNRIMISNKPLPL